MMNISIIDFSEPAFWQPRSDRFHYVSKSCDQLSRCESESRDKGLKCMRDWYRDWDCIECCQGDRCNSYVTVSLIGWSTVGRKMYVYYRRFIVEIALRVFITQCLPCIYIYVNEEQERYVSSRDIRKWDTEQNISYARNISIKEFI